MATHQQQNLDRILIIILFLELYPLDFKEYGWRALLPTPKRKIIDLLPSYLGWHVHNFVESDPGKASNSVANRLLRSKIVLNKKLIQAP